MEKNLPTSDRFWSAADFCADGACAEVKVAPDGTATLTSTLPGTGALILTGDEFTAFVNAAKDGRLDHLIG